MNLDQLTDAVWQRMEERKPRALLIGQPPDWDGPYCYVAQPPYEAVVLGVLAPGDLLHMPSDPVCRALLDGQPVYLWQPQPYRTCSHAKALCRELAAAEQHLKQLGVLPLAGQSRWITAQEARLLRQAGRMPQPGSHMTPLAREILEEKQT